MDGKQARRTKASLPLGLLIDHGTNVTTTIWIDGISSAKTKNESY